MSDPVQQAGGGEQLPATIAATSPALAPEVTAITTPEQKPPTVELPKAEPPKAEPPKAEASQSETLNAEPAKIENAKNEPPPTEPLLKVELQKVETQTVEPQTAEPPKAEPQTAGPPVVEQVKKEESAGDGKSETASVNIKGSGTVSDAKSELPPQETKDINGLVSEDKKDAVPVPETTQNVEASPSSSEKDEKSNVTPNGTENWQKRESELLKKIDELEKVKNARSEDSLKLELKIREEEIDLLKARVKNLETELQAALSKPGGKNHEMIENIKHQHEELLSKARGMIFDKTKMVKNQELQIQALTTQVQSLKDINVITKDLLEIRNSEVKAMEERFQAMEARYKAEKERYDLVLKRAQTSTNINDDLRKEYETQLAIFKELREKYEQRVQALVAENNRLKESVKGPSTSG